MTVKELNRDQIDELKWNLYWSEDFDNSKYESGEDIPDEVIFEYHEGTHFVEDDFFCSTEPEKKREEDKILNMIRYTNQGKTVYHFEIDFTKGYSIAIRTDFDTLGVEEANILLSKDVKEYGEVKGVFYISVEDMVKFYNCDNYKDWPLHHKPE